VCNQMQKGHETTSKIFYLFLIIGLVPCFVVFFLYKLNPDSSFLYTVADFAESIPAITSMSNQLMTKVMSIYCKTAPLFGGMWFLFSVRTTIVHNVPSKLTAIKSAVGLSVVLFFIVYIPLFFNHELTTSGRLLRLISDNDILLLFFYASLYAGISMFTYITILSYYLIYKIITGKHC